jgi:hypothetical protein
MPTSLQYWLTTHVHGHSRKRSSTSLMLFGDDNYDESSASNTHAGSPTPNCTRHAIWGSLALTSAAPAGACSVTRSEWPTTRQRRGPCSTTSTWRPAATSAGLPLVINKDLKLAAVQPHDISGQFNIPTQLKTITDLRRLETLANDSKQCIQLVQCVIDMQVTEPPKPIKLRPRRNVKQ